MEISIKLTPQQIKTATLALVGCAVACKALGWANWKLKNVRMNKITKEKLESRNRKTYTFDTAGLDIPFILSLDATQLREELIKGTFTSVDLVNVFAERNYYIGRAICSTTEELFEEALEDAKVKDREREEARKNGTLDQLPLLHGVPIGIKDQIKQKGTVSTSGCAFLCNDIDDEDGAVAILYRQAGAIPLVRGNCPQSAMSIHTLNLIWGETLNPHDKGRSPGGSSGGNAAQIAARLVPFGLGSDIGGSLRFPAAFCGIYGYKPTTGRFLSKGLVPSNKSKFSSGGHLQGTVGPMGSSVDDLILSMKIHCTYETHKLWAMHPPVPFREDKLADVTNPDNFKKIKIGILEEFPGLPLTKPLKRAIDEAAAAARKLGFEVVPFKITEEEYDSCIDIFMTQVANNKGIDTMIRGIMQGGETVLPPIQQTLFIRQAGFFMRKFLDFMLYYVLGLKRQHKMMRHYHILSFEDLEVATKERYAFVDRFAQKWREAGVTAVLAPQFPTPAFKLEHAGRMGLMLHYSILQNITGFPAGVFPVTKVRADEQDFEDSFNDTWTKQTQEVMKDSEGLPVAIQLIGYSYEDEQVLGLMKVLSKEIGYKLDLFEDELAKYKK